MASAGDERRGRVAYAKAAGIYHRGKSWEALGLEIQRVWIEIARAVMLDVVEGPSSGREKRS